MSDVGRFRIHGAGLDNFSIEVCTRDGYVDKHETLITPATWWRPAVFETKTYEHIAIFRSVYWVYNPEDGYENGSLYWDDGYGDGRVKEYIYQYEFASKEECKRLIDKYLEANRRRIELNARRRKHQDDNPPEWYP